MEQFKNRHIAILGTRGIPNNHGGFEQCAEYLAAGLVHNGYTVSVFNSHNHPFQEKEWKGVHIIHCYDPEDKLGTAGQFIYDFNCIMDARKRNFDIILQLGYTSNSIWGKLLPRNKSVITTNMDGLEWKRTKYSKPVRKFLKYAEKLAVKYSDYLISDSVGIQQYIEGKYNIKSTFIPYGANLFDLPDFEILKEYHLEAYSYDLLIARLEPENNIETILDGITAKPLPRPFLVIGKHTTPYGEYLKNKYVAAPNIIFLGGIYNLNTLNNLRYFSLVYFHGHTVGGTNPSLLEAMASNALICAHDNIFNRSILGDDAIYFTSSEDVTKLIQNISPYFKSTTENQEKLLNNSKKITTHYSWKIIVEQYVNHFNTIKLDNYNKELTGR